MPVFYSSRFYSSSLVFSQDLVCKQCDKTTKGSCTKDEKCTDLQQRCVVIHWGAQHVKPNTYTMRCGTEDECSDAGKRELCASDPDNCDVKCCTYSRCEKLTLIQTAHRDFRCYHCNTESLDSCEKSERKCDDDQDACLSFLMEGGNHQKVYTKRCARKDECHEEYRAELCREEVEESNRKNCLSSCCFEELCNSCALKSISFLTIIISLVVFFYL